MQLLKRCLNSKNVFQDHTEPTSWFTKYHGLMFFSLLISLAFLGGCESNDEDSSTTSNVTTPLTPTTPSQSTAYKLSAIEWYNDSGALRGRDVYESNADGNITQWQQYDSSGQLKGQGVYHYNAEGKLVKEDWDLRPFDGVVEDNVFYTYDAKSNKITAEAQGTSDSVKAYGIRIWSYDENGKLSSVSYGNDWTTAYQYDNGGRLLSLKGSDGSIYSSYGYDTMGKLISLWDDPNEVAFSYDSGGKLAQVAGADDGFGQSFVRTYLYDDQNRLVAVDYPSNTRSSSRMTITYDTNGNITQIARPEDGYTRYKWQEGKGWTGKEHFSDLLLDQILQGRRYGDTCLSVSRPVSPEEQLFNDMFAK